MFKKLLSVTLTAAVAITSLTGCTGAEASKNIQNALSVYSSASKELKAESIDPDDIEQVADLKGIPAIGETIDGFEVTGLYDFPERDGIIVQMEHVQSGAALVWVANNDQDMMFDVFYRTRPNNNKGIPHVFEHITLSGSGKYPNSSLWYDVASGTYNTFLNAGTYNQLTGYYAGSLSEDQLLSIADLHMSGLTDPLALRDSNPLKRESSRYQLYDMNEDITVTGAVYNEMESSNSQISQTAIMQTDALLYPGSSSSYNACGVRDDITEITLEELQEYYDKYYHPSNMLIALYGNMNIERFLSFLDKDYLSNYERQEIDLTEENYTPWTGFKSTVAYHPVEEGAPIENECICTYNIALNDISTYDFGYMSIIAEVLTSPSSPLVLRIEEEFPNIAVYSNESIISVSPHFGFWFNGANEGDEERLKVIIDEVFADIAKNGLDRDVLTAYADTYEAKTLISKDSHGGNELLKYIGIDWACSSDGNPAAYIDYINAYRNLSKSIDEGYLDKLFNDYLISPKCSLMLNTVPKPGLAEAQLAQHEKKLSDMKNSMTYWEKKQLIQDTEQFDIWSKKDADSVQLDTVACLDVSDLPETLTEISVNNEEVDGITMLSYENTDCGYLEAYAYYSASAVPTDKLLDFKLMCDLLGDMPTTAHSADELYNIFNSATYGRIIELYIDYDYPTGTVTPYLKVGYTTLDKNVVSANDLMDEVLTSTDFTDLGKARSLINNICNDLKSTMADSLGILNTQHAYARAEQDNNRKYDYYMNNYDYLEYLMELTKADDNTLADRLDSCNDILKTLLNKNGLIYTASGDADAIECGQQHMTEFAKQLDSSEQVTVDYATELSEILDLQKNAAFIVSDSNNYNSYIASAALCDEYGLSFNGMNAVILDAIYSNIVFPTFRYDVGAYSAEAGINNNNLYIFSYRDPGIGSSLDLIGQVPEKMTKSGITQREIDSSIMSIVGSYGYPETKKAQAQLEFKYIIANRGISNSDHYHKLIREAKSTTEDDFYATTPLLLNVLENATKCTTGNKANINAEKDRFDVIIDTLVK